MMAVGTVGRALKLEIQHPHEMIEKVRGEPQIFDLRLPKFRPLRAQWGGLMINILDLSKWGHRRNRTRRPEPHNARNIGFNI